MRGYSVIVFMTVALMVSAVACGSAQSSRNQGYLGASLGDLTPKLEKKGDIPVDKGAYISDVVEDGPADKAGIEEGDVIVKFDGKDIEDSGDLVSAVRRAKPKTEVTVELYRGKEKKSITVTLGKLSRSDAYAELFSNGFPWANPPRIMRVPRVPSVPRLYVFSQSDLAGLNAQDLSGQLAEYFEVPGGSGVLVVEVEKKSDAERAGFKAGDVIVKAGKRTVEDLTDLRRVLEKAQEGDEIAFDIIRKGKPVNLTMKVSDGEISYKGSRFYRSLENLSERWKTGRSDLFKDYFRRYRDITLEQLKRLTERLGDRLEGL